MELLAIVPARGGSKRVPNKNIAPTGGRPLIEWTISSARASRTVSRVIVSTDAEDIAAISRRCQAEVPFTRPIDLSQDDTPGMAVILHAIDWLLEHERYRPDFVVCLQPTSPFRTAQDIDGAMALLLHNRADSVVSVTPVEHHPWWMKRLDERTGRLSDFIPHTPPSTRSQDLPPAYALNGAIYLARRDVLLERKSWYTEFTCAYVMPRERSLDIDSPWELDVADLMLGRVL